MAPASRTWAAVSSAPSSLDVDDGDGLGPLACAHDGDRAAHSLGSARDEDALSGQLVGHAVAHPLRVSACTSIEIRFCAM